MTIGTKIYTWLNGNKVGTDQFGNCYFESKRALPNGKKKRWVMYKDIVDPSIVPPQWHGWLHYMTEILPETQYEWQKPYKHNMTGTSGAYFPPGHEKSGGQRTKVSSDYEAWKPE